MQNLSELARSDPQLKFRFDDELGVVRHLRGNLGTPGKRTPKKAIAEGMKFVRENSELFGDVSIEDAELLAEARDSSGGLDMTLQQYHGKIPVLGGSVRFHFAHDGALDTISNRLFPDLSDVPKRPRVGAEKATAALQVKTKCKTDPTDKPELIVFRHEGKARLAWRIQLNDTRAGARGVPAIWIGFIDASTGKVLHYYDNVQTAGPVTASGTGRFSGGGALNAWFNDTINQLRDTTRATAGGPEIITVDEDGAAPSEDLDGNWDDSSTTPRHSHQGPEVDAHRYAADVVDYFQTVHGRNSFDGAGSNLTTVVHVGTDFNNGYWDGTQVNLGDGDGVTMDYACSDDWLAHEFTHAYTQHTCGLTYWGQSGALNEAFSDIFAAFISGDWLVFEDTWLNATAPANRNMIDPTNGGNWDNSSETAAQASVLAGHQPSHWDDRYTGTWDNAGVHINSGIINNLFYLLTNGGTHATSGLSVAAIGQSAAERMLFRCMNVILVGNPNASFLDFREAMLDASQDLFPTDLFMLSQVKNAFNAVGIGPDIFLRDNVGDAGEEPYAGSYLWASPDIINRTAPSANPATDFSNLSDDTLWQNVEFGQDNFIYARLQNRGNQTGDATLSIYFSAASTFGTPASWINIGTLVETGIAPGELRIAGPLTFPAALIPAPGHYCMIGVASDTLDPAPDHTLIASVSDYLDFVRNSNNIAYRNMDVVDLIPGMPGVVEAEVRTLRGLRGAFDLRIDAGKFMPGARLRVRGPAWALDGAIPLGLKLAARNEGENIYDVLVGRNRVDRLRYLRRDHENQMGFDRILIDKDFPIRVEYLLPDKKVFKQVGRRIPKDGYRIAIRQLWKKETVGAVGLQLRKPKRTRPRLVKK